MRFREYLDQNEAFNIGLTDVMNVVKQFSEEGDGIHYRFEIMGSEYDVTFQPFTLNLYGEDLSDLDKAYEINFYGGGSMDYSGQQIPMTVHEQMLTSVAAFIWKYKPQGFRFLGLKPGMDLVYANYVSQYLGDAPGKSPEHVFYQFGAHEYVNKAQLDKKLNTLSDWAQEAIRDEIDGWSEGGQQHQRQTDKKRVEKKSQKEAKKTLQSYIGKFFMPDEGPAFLYNCDRDFCRAVYVAGRKFAYKPIMIKNLNSPQQVTDALGNPWTIEQMIQQDPDYMKQFATLLFQKTNWYDKLAPAIPPASLQSLRAIYDEVGSPGLSPVTSSPS